MLHACVQRFDVTGNLEKFCKILETKQALNSHFLSHQTSHSYKNKYTPTSKLQYPRSYYPLYVNASTHLSPYPNAFKVR